MISLWWSFTLTVVGVTGLVLVYRSQSIVGPLVSLTVQGLWIAYAISTSQWWFLVSAFAFSAANIYGITTRRKKAAAQAAPTEWRGPWEVRARLAETRVGKLEAEKKVAPFVNIELHNRVESLTAQHATTTDALTRLIRKLDSTADGLGDWHDATEYIEWARREVQDIYLAATGLKGKSAERNT